MSVLLPEVLSLLHLHRQVLVCNGCHECDDHSDESNCTTSRDKSEEGKVWDDMGLVGDDAGRRGDDLRCPTDTGMSSWINVS